ncbi:MAG: acyltransferase [Clostridiales bacterium]|nr:acyltransferase [Clostridiales bacterium]
MSKNESQALKGIAIIMMLFHHCFAFPSRYEGYQIVTFLLSEETLNTLASFCKITVGIFAFVSGYGLSAQSEHLKDEKIPAAVGRRCRKMLVSFWVIAIPCMIALQIAQNRVISVYFQDGRVNGVFYLLIDLLGLRTVFGTPTICGEWWYVGTALIFILSAQFWRKAISKYRWLPLAAFVLVPRILDVGYLGGTVPLSFTMPYLFGIYFQTCDLFPKLDQAAKKLGAVGKLLLALVLFTVSFFLYHSLDSSLYEIRFGISPLLFILACRMILSYTAEPVRALSFIGKYSGNMYYLHSILLYALLPDFLYQQSWCGLTLLWLLAITLVVSVLIEKSKSWFCTHRRGLPPTHTQREPGLMPRLSLCHISTFVSVGKEVQLATYSFSSSAAGSEAAVFSCTA